MSYELCFGRDLERRALLTGWVRSGLWLVCQRCLGEVRIDVDASLALVLLKTEASASDLQPELESLVVGDQPLRVLDLIEDELLLAIPAIPRHDDGQCQTLPGVVREESAGSVEAEATAAAERPNPFAVLGALKDQGQGDA
ncbi:YceD family protein [Thiocystis violacea]|uniref:YceD family protein n=1 Tax=Thiocystis violacea TaxID=13725 RepID=UPI00190616F2